MNFELKAITNTSHANSKFKNGPQKVTRNGLIFHVKIREKSVNQYYIDKINKRSISLVCFGKHKGCAGRLSAGHEFNIQEVGQSGKNKLYDFHQSITQDQLKNCSSWELSHAVCQIRQY